MAVSTNTGARTVFHYDERYDSRLHTHLDHETTLADKSRLFYSAIVDRPDAVDGLKPHIVRRPIEPRAQRLLPDVTPGRGSACAVLCRARR
jgi:hypothetical protein